MILQTLMGALGSLGFGILLGMKPKHLPLAMLGGGITWAVYLLSSSLGAGLFFSNLIAALAANFWAWGMAHIRKAPATIFTITAVVPLIPGSGLYHTMSAFVYGQEAEMLRFGNDTLLTAAAIGCGALIFTAGIRMAGNLRERKA